MSGSGVSWAICKSAFRSRQITMPAPHHSVFYRPFLPPNRQRQSTEGTRIFPGNLLQTGFVDTLYHDKDDCDDGNVLDRGSLRLACCCRLALYFFFFFGSDDFSSLLYNWTEVPSPSKFTIENY